MAPQLERSGSAHERRQARQRLLNSCELALRRIENEPDLARPAGYLFEQVRTLFPIQRQPRVRRAIELHVELAQRLLELRPPRRRECAAFNRQGVSCRREAVNGDQYCPSHRHLESPVVASPAGAEGDQAGTGPLRPAV